MPRDAKRDAPTPLNPGWQSGNTVHTRRTQPGWTMWAMGSPTSHASARRKSIFGRISDHDSGVPTGPGWWLE